MKALALTLELARANEAGDPFAFRFEPQTYNVRWENGTYAGAELGWDEALQADLAALQGARPDPAARQRLGELLRTFLGDAGWEAREEEIAAAVKLGRTIHLTVRSAAAELYALPWELLTLRSTGEHLGELPRCLLRYEWPGTETAAPAPDPPPEGGRILFAWSGAGGAVPAAEHLDAIRRAATAGHHLFDEERDVVAGVSTASLRRALAAAPVAVLHVLCHGGRVASATEAYGLAWDAAEPGGAPDMIDAAALRALLKPHAGTLRLVVLMACHGASAGEAGNALGGVAQALHRIGIPAVVASRQPLSTRGSIALAEALYARLLEDFASLEDALLHARRALIEDTASGDWAAIQLYARAADGPDHRPFIVRPFRGLLAFREEHARTFFGRQTETDEAVLDLSALSTGSKPRFFLVTGASGTGKSSLVFAGIVPGLQAKNGGKWRVVPMRPRDGAATIDAALASRGDAPLLFLVDQFEEIFTDLADKEARVALVRRLWALAGDPASGVSVIATLRVDFLARCGEISLGAGELYLEGVAYDESHRVFVRRMTLEHLREVIEQPARLVGLALDEGLVEQALKDAGDEPGALPLVEYTLDQLWQARAREGARYRLTWEAYKALGGVTGALAKKADAILAGLDEVRRRAARRLLVQLVDTREDAHLDTRRRVRVDKLRPGPEAEAAVFGEVLETLARERLVVLSQAEGDAKTPPIVEIAHEQIVRSWKTLRGWLSEDRERILEMAPLTTWAAAAKGAKGYVLQGEQLARAQALLVKYASELDAEERELIERSAAAARRRRRWARAAGVAVGVAAVLMGVLAIIAWQRGNRANVAEQKANEQARRARIAARMAGARDLLAHGEPALASRVLLEVDDPEATPGWLGLAHEVLSAGVVRAVLRGHESSVNFAAFSPDGSRVVTTSDDKTARVWSTADGKQLAILKGHELGVSRAAFSPDGLRVVTASDDKTARVWSAADGKQLALLKGHEDRVNSAAWSPDGLRVVTASVDKTARVWSALEGKQLALLKGHESGVYSAAWSPDGSRIVTASFDKTARVWTAVEGTELAILKGHEDRVSAAAFSPDGLHVVTVSQDNTARVWSSGDGKERALLKGHEDSVRSAAWSADGLRIVTASDDKTARVWSAAEGKQLALLKGHEDYVNSAAWSADGRRIVTTSLDKTARVWSAAEGIELTLLKGHEGGVVKAAFCPDDSRVVTVSYDKTARVWNTAVGIELALFKGHEGVVNSAAFSPDGLRVVTASSDQTARVWSAADGKQTALFKGHEDRVNSAAWSPDGLRVVTASKDKTARVWNAADGIELALFKEDDGINSATFSPDGLRVVTASDDNTARVWDVADGKQIALFKGHKSIVNTAAFRPDGLRVVTASYDNTARMWDVAGGKQIALFKGHKDTVHSAAFRPDGLRIVTASDDKTARVWNVEDGMELALFKGHEEVYTAGWSPDGLRVVTGSYDRTARVWSADGRELALLQGHWETVSSAAFSPDGMRVVTASKDKTARVWAVSGSTFRRVLAEATTLCLPPAMREAYLTETEAEARAGYEVCERAQGRIPAAVAAQR